MKRWVEQEIVNRESRTSYEGVFGFSNYVTEWEDYNTFICRVSSIADKMIDNGKLLNISYPNENIAIITCIKSEK